MAATSPYYDYKIEKLADGVYAFVMPDPVASIVTGNSLLVVGDDGALVLDTGHFPSLARRMISDIKKITPLPVRYVVTSHWHPDHLFGNGAFRDAFPGVVLLAHAETRRLALAKDPEQIEAQRGTAQRVERFKRHLATGQVKPGRELTAGERLDVEATLPELEATVGDSNVEFVPPTATFAGNSVSIYLGKREVRVMHLGRGNTAGDVMVYVPDANVLATGDVLVSPVPYAYGSYIGEWAAVLGKVAAMHPAVILPGHGPLERDASHVDRLSALIASLRKQVDECVKAGMTLDETKKKVDVKELRRGFTADNALLNAVFDDAFTEQATARAYEEAKGAISDE